jgi:hypothetical protein
MKWAVAAVMTSGLLGCGGSQPSIYRVAIDRLTPATVPTACYRAGQAPTAPDKTTNMVDTEQWVFWEGVEDVSYLDIGDIGYNMGQAQGIDISGDAIQGEKNDDGEYIFKAERTETESATEIYTTSATYTIEKLGETIEGTLALRSACAGTDCGGTPTCDVSLNFVGRKINTDQLSVYDTEGGN